MRSTGLMTFPLSLSWAAWLIWLSSLGLHQPVKREAALAPELRRHFVELGWLLSGGRSMTGILEEDAVPDQFIPALIAREPTGAGWIDALQLHPVSDVALQPGDDLVAISAAHTVRRVVGDTTSGRPVAHRRF